MSQNNAVVVAGGGMAGLVASLMLARSGRRVRLVERDVGAGGESLDEAFHARRTGVPQYHQPHAFMPRAFALLRDRLPDVLDTLRCHGATEVDLAPATGERARGDEDLVFLGVRRALIEWALRRAVQREPNIDLIHARVTGLWFDEGSPLAVRGLLTDIDAVAGSLVVDAMGRASPTPGWLADRGIALSTEASEVGIVYYSRYFRLRDGVALPPSPSPFGPRVDHGFASAATFIGDNRSYCIVVMVPTWDSELKAVRHAAAFEAFCRATPTLAPLVDSARAEALTDVLPMGALKTVWHDYGHLPLRGLIAMGDSFCHTDPSFALGICNALVQAAALSDVATTQADADVPAAFYARVSEELRERFEFARDIAAARIERMRGLPVVISRTGCYPLYSLMASLGCASLDPQVHRMAYRRHGFLDRLAQFDDDEALQQKVESLFALVVARLREAPRVDRTQLLEMIGSAPAPKRGRESA